MRRLPTILSAALWLVVVATVLVAWRAFGASTVATVLGLVAALAALAPLLPSWPWKWSRPVTESTDEQIASASAQLAAAVSTQWDVEARRRGLDERHQMAVRWVAEPSTDAAGLERLGLGTHGTLEELVAVVPAMNQPLLILGGPGTGKTGLLVRLTLELARQITHERAPVLLPVSGWDPGTANVNTWLMEQLVEAYPFLANPRRFGGTLLPALLRRGLVLPLLDGLDELPERRRVEALAGIISDLRSDQRFVVACRTKEFEAIREDLPLHGLTIVRLEPLGREDAIDYLERTVGFRALRAWRPVLDRLRSGTADAAAEALSLPLNLFLARVTYDDGTRSPAELLDTAVFPEAGAIETHLLDRYVPSVFLHRPDSPDDGSVRSSPRWPPGAAEVWMTTFAVELARQKTRALAWWRMHEQVPRVFSAAVGAIEGGVSCALLGAFIFGTYGRPWLGLALGTLTGVFFGAVFAVSGHAEPRRRGGGVPTLTREDVAPRALLQEAGFGLVGAVVGLTVVGVIFTPAAGAVVGAVFGVAFGLAQRVVSRPAEPRVAISPLALLVRDRQTVTFGFLFGGLVGAFVGAGITLLLDPRAHGLAVPVTHTWQLLLLGVASGFVMGACGLGLLFFATSAWGQLTSVRLWLLLTRRGPFQVMAFLHDAHRLGVVRQIGPFYEIRHALLADRLVETADR